MQLKDFYVVTPLSKLLAKAYGMDPELSFREFCKLNNITPRYLSGLLQLNNLSPKLKRMIMAGYQPKHISIHDIIAGNVPVLWKEQEEWMIGEITLEYLTFWRFFGIIT